VSEFDLTDRICIVTGGGRGIGRAIAEGLARHGATLVLSGRTEATLAEAASAIGGRASVQVADVAREADVLMLRDATPASTRSSVASSGPAWKSGRASSTSTSPARSFAVSTWVRQWSHRAGVPS